MAGLELPSSSDAGERASAGGEMVKLEIPLGPLGITFVWNGGLRVASFAPVTGIIERDDPTKAHEQVRDRRGAVERSGLVQRGASLVAVDEISVEGLAFDECIELLRNPSAASTKLERRIMVFRNAKQDGTAGSEPSEDGSPRSPAVSCSADSHVSLSDTPQDARQRLCDTNAGPSDEHALETPARSGIAPRHAQIERVLASKLDPLFLDVRNVTRWYDNRRALGVRHFWHRGLKQNANSRWWECRLYYLRLDEESGNFVPREQYLGAFKSERKAIKTVQEAATARDLGDPLRGHLTDQPKEPATSHDPVVGHVPAHRFTITVVSEAFRRLDVLERNALVIQALLDGFRKPRLKPAWLSRAKLRWRGFSTVGASVLNLPQFDSLDFAFALQCLTPTQWDPKAFDSTLTDRFGAAHISSRAQGSHPSSKVAAKLVRSIVQEGAGAEHDEQPAPRKVKEQRQHAAKPPPRCAQRQRQARRGSCHTQGGGNDDDGGALDPHSSTAQHRAPVQRFYGPRTAAEAVQLAHIAATQKSGGVFSHFFHGLNPTMKRMVLREHYEAMKAAGADGLGNQQVRGAQSSLELLAKMYDRKEKSEAPDHKFSAKKMALARHAVALQRQFRARLQFKVCRWLLRRHAAACTTQRLFRGHVEREFVHEWREVATIASIVIQAARRAMYGRIEARSRRATLEAVARAVQPVVRAFIARRFVAWVRCNAFAALQMQRVVRGFVERQHFKLLVRQRFFRLYVVGAATQLQRLFRSYRVRNVVAMRRAVQHFFEVEVPASVIVARCYRGHRGRREAHHRRTLRDAATLVAAVWRRFVARKLYLAIIRRRLEEASALIIQTKVRQIIAVEVVDRRRARRHHTEVIIPAVMRIQTVFRSFLCRCFVKNMVAQSRAARVIQRPYRRMMVRRQQNAEWERMQQEWTEMVTRKLQRCWRGHHARALVSAKMKEQHGIWGAASLVVQAVWRGYLARVLYKQKRARAELEDIWDLFEECKEELEEIDRDMEMCKLDIKSRNTAFDRKHARLHELRHQRNEWLRRLPQVEKLIDEVTADDINHGWAEAYEVEWDMITNGLDMLEEEIRHRKIQRRVAFQDLEELHLEIENIEQDRDENATLQTAFYERFRKLELERADERRDTSSAAAESKQRLRWAIKSTRCSAIRRSRRDLDRAEREARGVLTVPEASTISFKKRNMRVKAEQKRARHLHREHTKAGVRKRAAAGFDSQVLRVGYNQVVMATQEVLKRATLELRKPKSDLREDKRAMCWNCGRVFCECPEEISVSYTRAVNSDEDAMD